MRQCTCGRSNAYPYCDGTHKLKKIQKEENIEIKTEEEQK
jgi:CDGSH-type Zn-finger protein